jgi:hypothetical protein
VETVQSDIASEKPGIFEVFREGVCRLVSWSSPRKGTLNKNTYTELFILFVHYNLQYIHGMDCIFYSLAPEKGIKVGTHL